MRQRRWSEKYPGLGTSPLPTEPYISEEHFALERERVFRRSWLQVGRVEEIPHEGSYFVRDIAICNASVLVIRGSDGIVRGFHNVCSHRSNRLVADERGSCGGALFCRFHNWAYSDRGELIGVPDEENFFGLDKREHGLTPVDTDIWEGFIFVHLAPDPAETLREYLGGVANRLDGCRFHEMELSQVYRVEERANWKIVLDAQNEVYHLPYQHRWTLGNAFAKNETGNCRFKEVILFDYHSFWSCDYRSFQDLTPLKIALFFGGDDAGAFRVPNMIGDLDHYLLFPNGILSLFKVGRWMGCITYMLWPIAVDRTVWEIRMHFSAPATWRERLQQEYFKCVIRDTLQEDTAAHESVHAGIASRVRTHLILQDNELPIRHFHKVLGDYAGYGSMHRTGLADRRQAAGGA